MELLLWVIAIGAAIIWFFRWVDSQGQKEKSRTSIPDLQTRVRRDASQGRAVYNIEARGRMPIDEVTIRWECRMVDLVTEKPILTTIPPIQEENSTIYLFKSAETHVPRGGFINEWSAVAAFPDGDCLIAPYSGRRNVQVVLDLNSPILDPFASLYDNKTPKAAWRGWETVKQFKHSLVLDFELPGYVEEEENKQLARVLTVKLAVGMALADGHIDRAEGRVIQQWIRRHAREFGDEEEFRAFARICNKAMREADAQVRAGGFPLDEMARELADVGNPRWKYEAIELLHKIAAADGVAQEEETRMLWRLSDLLDLDRKEVERIRDKEFMKVKKLFSGCVLDELGISRDAPPDEIKKKLRAEFRKWNGRLNARPEEREHSQWMIDRIAAARKKYE